MTQTATLATGNPALSINRLTSVKATTQTDRMTVGGTIAKTLLLVIVFGLGMVYMWQQTAHLPVPTPQLYDTTWIASFLAFITGMVAVLKPETIKVTAFVYAALQGIAIGAWTVILDFYYPDIAMQAVGLTTAILIATLALYQTRVIKATDKFKSMVIIATVGVAIYYCLVWLLSLFGLIFDFTPLYYTTGGIFFPLLIVGLASLNLILDFDTIEQGAKYGASKKMEWFAAYGLILTLIWLYVSIIRLLIRSNR